MTQSRGFLKRDLVEFRADSVVNKEAVDEAFIQRLQRSRQLLALISFEVSHANEVRRLCFHGSHVPETMGAGVSIDSVLESRGTSMLLRFRYAMPS